ncbi:hypothetical protein E2I00_008906, partial [Balaenoptera physalus]
KIAYIKFEDKVSGELFAQAPVEQYPGIAVETVTDSSCYFVIWIQDGTGHSAFIGIGSSDRDDAFDFNVSFQDHFKWVKQESEISKESQEMDNRPKLDLGFKEGQTIKLRTTGAGGLSLLPPPPGGRVTIPPPSSSVAIGNHVHPPSIPKSNHGSSDADILLDLDSPAPHQLQLQFLQAMTCGETLALHPALFQTRHHSHPTGSSSEEHWQDIKDRLEESK